MQLRESSPSSLSVFQRRFLRLQFSVCQRPLRWHALPFASVVIGAEMRILSFLCLLMLCGCNRQIADRDDTDDRSKAGTDAELLVGDWEIVECWRDGKEFPSEIGGTISFGGKNAEIVTTDGARTVYRIEINDLEQPSHIDWILTQAGETQTLHGIYELDGGRLSNCSPATFGDDRPGSMETVQGDGRWLFRLRRTGQEDRQ